MELVLQNNITNSYNAYNMSFPMGRVLRTFPFFSVNPLDKRIFHMASTEDIMSRLQKTIEKTQSMSRTSPGSKPPDRKSDSSISEIKLIALACSTGGPQALHTVIPILPEKIGVPIVIVQHMPNGFTASLAERLDSKSKLTVKEAEDGEILLDDTVYIAPGGRHLEIKDASGGRLKARVFDDPPFNNLRPCADVTYESIKHTSIDNILCVVLTGMGADGSAGIASLGQKKSIYVITQSEDTCVVYGMPKATDKLGLTNESVPLDGIANAIVKKVGV